MDIKEIGERKVGHKALRVKKGKLESFDPHPQEIPKLGLAFKDNEFSGIVVGESLIEEGEVIDYIKALLFKVKGLQQIMTADPDHWDGVYVKWATEKAESRIKELEMQLDAIRRDSNAKTRT